MKYDYTKIYNEYWQKFMDKCDIESIGILRKDKTGNEIFGFSNVFSDDNFPYDFCARIGYQVLLELQQENVSKIEVSKGSYIFAQKCDKR